MLIMQPGIDVSWIWDGNFEDFATMDIPAVVSQGGDRHTDMTAMPKSCGCNRGKNHGNERNCGND